jgi:hypothetical protein
MAVNTSAAHLAPQTGGFEPQRSFNWLFKILIPNSVSNAGGDPYLILSCEKVTFPRYGTKVITMRFLNENRKVSGAADVQALSVTYRDFVDVNTYKIINSWMNKVHSIANGSIGLASRYKTTGHLTLLTPEGVSRGEINCEGVWPNEFSASDLDYESDTGLIKVNLTLQVDKFDGLNIETAGKVSEVGENEILGPPTF